MPQKAQKIQEHEIKNISAAGYVNKLNNIQ